MLFKEWAIYWLKYYKSNELRLKTYDIYNNLITNYFIPSFGNIKLNNIDMKIISKYINNNKNILSNNTLNLHITLIKSIMNCAYDNNIIKKNNLKNLKRLSSYNKEINIFNIDDQRKIEKYIINSEEQYKYLGIILTFYTGLRLGELLALKWDNVDFKENVIYVEETVSRVKIDNKYQNILSPPKTNKSNRTIPISKEIKELLVNLKRKKISEYVVSNKDGTQMLMRSYQHIFKSVQKKAGIKYNLNFHAIRHTFATRAIEIGIDVKTVSELLGHSNVNITLNIYVHSMFETKKKAMNKLSKMIFNT